VREGLEGCITREKERKPGAADGQASDGGTGSKTYLRIWEKNDINISGVDLVVWYDDEGRRQADVTFPDDR
jgi:hypothetical protein